MIAISTPTPELEDLRWFLANCRDSKIRTMRQFAEDEIIIPDGPFKGRRFRVDRQPYSGLLFDQIDSGKWQRNIITGPTQSGKTLSGYVVPMLYHLFEVGETVIGGLPSMDMAGDKWEQDILPAIEASRYRELLPTRGAGSRGGKFSSITFLNGATLRFMSGGGNDKKRAGFTSRVVVITETDGMDEAGDSSREADKITQIEGRTRAYGSQARIYMECTVSIEKGRTWQEYTKGSESRIVVRCGHCGDWVTPERDHLAGWQDAESKVAARASARFLCPSCGVLWTEEERRTLNEGAKVVHRGQEVTPEGVIVGDKPETDTLGFRWNAFNNLFVTSGDIGADEWRAAHAVDSENAEKELRQFVWTLPHEPEQFDSTPLEQDAICRRTARTGRGIVPPGTSLLTAGVDIGMYVGHWVAVAWSSDGAGVVVDYGVFDIASRDLTAPVAILAALRNLRSMLDDGFNGAQPEAVWVDSGFEKDAVYAFTKESGSRYRPTKGHGVGQERTTPYKPPSKLAKETPLIGDGWHVAYQQAEKVWLIHLNSDHWKSRVHQFLTSPAGKPGSLALYDAPAREHLTLARHLTAERQVEEFIAGKGTVTRWVRDRKQNHYLDCLTGAVAAADHLGIRPTPSGQTRSTQSPQRSETTVSLKMPDGRPYLITER